MYSRLKTMAKWFVIFFSLLVLSGCSASFDRYPNQIRVAVYTAGCLDVLDASTADGQPVQYYACGPGKQSQEWYITPLQSTAEVQIMNANSKKCMAVSGDAATGGVTAPGQRVIQEVCATNFSAPSQLWKIVPATDGTPGEQFINVASGQCLDLPYGAIASIDLMQQYLCTPGDPAQGWDVHPVQLGNIP
jgi:hypothetical protein